MESVEEMEGDGNTNPPLRKDQHPLLAMTVPMHVMFVALSTRLALIRDGESALLILIQTVVYIIISKFVF